MCVVHGLRKPQSRPCHGVCFYGGAANAYAAAFPFPDVNLYVLYKTAKYRAFYFTYFNTQAAFFPIVQRLRRMCGAVDARVYPVCRTRPAHLPHMATKPRSGPEKRQQSAKAAHRC